MKDGNRISVIIPALNEEAAIGHVLSHIPEWVDETIVVDNGSSDGTPQVAEQHGARVYHEPRRGYGSACLTGMAQMDDPDVVVFLDGDYSDHPDEMHLLVDPIISGQADMVIGSRAIGERESGALTVQARFGNWLSCLLMRLIWGVHYTDLGPFRAISADALFRLNMFDPNYGWTIEMQARAARRGVREMEVPVSYRRRIGKSKVSGTVKGVIFAGVKILYTIFAEWLDSVLWAPERDDLERLCVFTRWPQPGTTKTRLIPELGEEGAANLQREMTEHALSVARRASMTRPFHIEVRYEGGDKKKIREWLGEGLSCRPQSDGDIGKRMSSALSDAFDGGVERCVVVGTDVPGITTNIITDAFEKLDENDLVLGPAKDGGYYLVGLRKKAVGEAVPYIFEKVPWSTEVVLETTLEKARNKSLETAVLGELSDVDEPDELEEWERVKGNFSADSISVIIPALNEEGRIEEAVKSACPERTEVIVADGGSIDNTAEEAQEAGAKVVTSPAGRAAQMNSGAVEASGDVLLFLHADTLLPENFDLFVKRALKDANVAGGAFRLCIESETFAVKAIESLSNFRSTRLKSPYGDQAIFVRADVFNAIGGFPDRPIMEDYEFVHKLRKRGKIAYVPYPVVTSGRRWDKLGVIRTTIINQLIIAGHFMGISSGQLARLYGRKGC